MNNPVSQPVSSKTAMPLSDSLVEKLRSVCGGNIVAGVDEVGRGAWAGPVAVGAVVLPSAAHTPTDDGLNQFLSMLNDSKKLSVKKRTTIAKMIPEYAIYCSVGFETADTVNRKGLSYALTSATVQALKGLGVPVDGIVLDGVVNYLSGVEGFTDLPVLLGERLDGSCSSVAAASILAKVCRDEHMAELAQTYPHYGWEKNKGYFSPQHHAGLTAQGAVLGEHRTSWAWVEKYSNVEKFIP